MQGSPADLAKSGVDFAKLVGIVETTETEENPDKRPTSRRSSTRSASSNSLNGSTDGFQDGSDNDDDEDGNKTEGVEMEASSKGKVKGSIAGNYFKAGAHWSILFVLAISFLIVQFLASAADYWVSIW